jgi:hypothetical protein
MHNDATQLGNLTQLQGTHQTQPQHHIEGNEKRQRGGTEWTNGIIGPKLHSAQHTHKGQRRQHVSREQDGAKVLIAAAAGVCRRNVIRIFHGHASVEHAVIDINIVVVVVVIVVVAVIAVVAVVVVVVALIVVEEGVDFDVAGLATRISNSRSITC